MCAVGELVDRLREGGAGLLDVSLDVVSTALAGHAGPSRLLPREPSALLGSLGDMARLSPGDPAPDFTLPDADGNDVSLHDFKGSKVVVYFYPAAMTPGCTKQACDFRDSLNSLRSAGYAVVGISPDKPEKLAKFRERDAVNFPLLSDTSKTALDAYGAYGEKTMYGKTVTGVLRSTFVVDEGGKVERAQYNVKATGHVAKLRKDLGLD
jgi:peroxiredoxin Q/BCP